MDTILQNTQLGIIDLEIDTSTNLDSVLNSLGKAKELVDFDWDTNVDTYWNLVNLKDVVSSTFEIRDLLDLQGNLTPTTSAHEFAFTELGWLINPDCITFTMITKNILDNLNIQNTIYFRYGYLHPVFTVKLNNENFVIHFNEYGNALIDELDVQRIDVIRDFNYAKIISLTNRPYYIDNQYAFDNIDFKFLEVLDLMRYLTHQKQKATSLRLGRNYNEVERLIKNSVSFRETNTVNFLLTRFLK